MGQKLRADNTADGEKDGDDEGADTAAEHDAVVTYGPGDCVAIMIAKRLHGRVFPLPGAFAKGKAAQNRGQKDGKDEGAEEGEGHRPRHGMEEAPLDRLQGKDGQIGSDDDGDGVEDRTLHLVA